MNNSNVLRERYTKLEKQKDKMMAEIEILHIDFDDSLDEFDSETNRFRDRYEKCQDYLEQTIKDYESMSNKL